MNKLKELQRQLSLSSTVDRAFMMEAIQEGLDEIKEWKSESKRLWALLDDISTAGDMFKPEIDGYFKYVNNKTEERDGLLYSDGYEILEND